MTLGAGLVQREVEVRALLRGAQLQSAGARLMLCGWAGAPVGPRNAVRRAPAAGGQAGHREERAGTPAKVRRSDARALLVCADLLGAPPCSSSLVAGPYFERLLTRFSVPEELFGPLSLRGLEADLYCRKTEWC